MSKTWIIRHGKIFPSVFFFFIAFFVFLIALGGVFLLNRISLNPKIVNSDPKKQIIVKQILTNVPPGMTREAFLEEVQYLGNIANSIENNPENLQRLKESFALHPWVEKELEMESPKEGGVKFQFGFRKAVLRIRLQGNSNQDSVRAVDRQGIVLPVSASTGRLAEFYRLLDNFKATVGKPVDQEDVKLCANLAGFLQEAKWIPFVPVLGVENQKIFIQSPDGAIRILWGNPLGQESQQEPTADIKKEQMRILLQKPNTEKSSLFDLTKIN